MKKWLSFLLSLCLLVGLTACGVPGPEDSSAPDAVVEAVYNGWFTEGDNPITQSRVQAIVGSAFTAPKNVIIMIGDGMGPNDLVMAAKHAAGVSDFGLVLDQFPHHGLATTHSANEDITDSAASGTALSTGVKTNNGCIATAPDGTLLKTMAETAREAGKKVGIVTDDVLSGATPTAFTVHNESRYNSKELSNAMVNFKPDVLIAQDYMKTYATLEGEARTAFNNDYLVAKDFDEFREVLDTDKGCKKPFIGFTDGYTPAASNTLAQCTETALARLENEKGFFLMVESCGTDKYGQNNNINGKLNSVVTLDRAVTAVLRFMETHPDTLLIVTSDHDTGGIQLPAGEDYRLSDLLTTKEHTATLVRVFALGMGSEYFSGKTVDNTDIAKFLQKAIKGE